MAYAYGRAFEELAEPGLALWPKRDDLMQPMVYLARHSMELQLKRAIKDYQDYVGDKSAIATRRIKAYPMLRSIPIIAVTSYALSADEQKARDAGCDDFVPKPRCEERGRFSGSFLGPLSRPLLGAQRT